MLLSDIPSIEDRSRRFGGTQLKSTGVQVQPLFQILDSDATYTGIDSDDRIEARPKWNLNFGMWLDHMLNQIDTSEAINFRSLRATPAAT
jgi:hypothetical protein